MAQATNLLTQLSLVALLGQERFADLGLGLMAATSVCFLGEIGFGPYFMRQSAISPDWLETWRRAAGSRLAVSAAAFALAWFALGWGAPRPDSARMVLIFAVPGIIASVVLPTPLLFGIGRVRTASASILCRFAVQALICVPAAKIAPDGMETWLGIAFSSGILVQVLAGQMAGLPIAALLPLRPRSLPPRPALRVWALSLVGTANDRALPFVIGASQPEILAPALIALQVLQTLAGIGGQIDRLLIPRIAREGDRGSDLTDVWRPLLLFMVFVAAIFVLSSGIAYPAHLMAALLVAAEWSMVLIGSLTFAVAFARGAEREVSRFMLVAVPLSTVAQVALGKSVPLEAVLALRAGVAAMAAWLAARSSRAGISA